MVTNKEFIDAIFGADSPWCHVTDFPYDPGNIPKDKHLIAWKGDYFSRYHIQLGTNQYFTISTFYADEQQQARRRKALYRQTHCIVLDDVKEKLSMDEVLKLPRPSWILETSKGSEQWGYILTLPCTNRSQVENLLDGLVSNGLAPEGKDPGMRGVTRYVRLPEGSNNKASKLINNLPYKCQMTLWEPFNRVTIEQLAEPFSVDLNAIRREGRVDGAAAVSDHPLINIPNIIQIKEVRSNGRFDIICPWVDGHTDADDSGSAVFTNNDGSIGFKCHHGSCQQRTGRDLLLFIEQQQPGFRESFKNWQLLREFKAVAEPNFMVPAPRTEPVSFMQPAPAATQTTAPVNGVQILIDELRRINHRSPEARDLATNILKHVDDLPKLDKLPIHTDVCDLMQWGKGEFKEILKDLRKQWYNDKVNNADFYDAVLYVKELNQFYDYRARIFFTPDAFQNSFSHEELEAKKIALQDGRVKKVDKLDYAPKQPRIFTENGTLYGNTWTDCNQSTGAQGDVARWRDHFDAVDWGDNRKHIEQWMAYTLRFPEKKINHMLLLGSGEGCGKDFLLYPLAKAMGDNYTVISGEELLRDFDDHLLSTKYIHINETELGNIKEARAISNRLKPLAAAPPETLRVNQKGIKPIKIRNIVNATMTTNSVMPVRLNGPSRRFYAVWSDLNPRDEDDNMRQDWLDYWEDRWNWMKADGWKHVAYHLMYEVDLSDFNPGEAPPMTEFLREIKEASKSPMQQTIEKFIKTKLGIFSSDLVTASEMSETLVYGETFAPNHMYTDGRYFTPTKIGIVMRESGQYRQVKTYYLGSTIKLWILRNSKMYLSMDSKTLYAAYMSQIKLAKARVEIKAVK